MTRIAQCRECDREDTFETRGQLYGSDWEDLSVGILWGYRERIYDGLCPTCQAASVTVETETTDADEGVSEEQIRQASVGVDHYGGVVRR